MDTNAKHVVCLVITLEIGAIARVIAQMPILIEAPYEHVRLHHINVQKGKRTKNIPFGALRHRHALDHERDAKIDGDCVRRKSNFENSIASADMSHSPARYVMRQRVPSMRSTLSCEISNSFECRERRECVRVQADDMAH